MSYNDGGWKANPPCPYDEGTDLIRVDDGTYQGRIDGINDGFSADGQVAVQIIDGGGSYHFSLFDLEAHKPLFYDNNNDPAPAVSSGSHFVANQTFGHPATEWTFDDATGARTKPVTLPGSALAQQLAFLGPGNRLIGVGDGGLAVVWDPTRNPGIDVLSATSRATAASWSLSPDGSHIALSPDATTVTVQDLASGTTTSLAALAPGEQIDSATPFVFTPDDRLLVVNAKTADRSHEEGIVVDLTTGHIRGRVPVPITAASGDSSTLAGWDFATATAAQVFRAADLSSITTVDVAGSGLLHSTGYWADMVVGLGLDPGGAHLAVATNQGRVGIFDLPGGHLARTLETDPELPGTQTGFDTPRFEQLAFSPTGDRLALTSSVPYWEDVEHDFLWDTSTWALVATQESGRTSTTTRDSGLRFSNDGSLLLTRGGNLFDAHTLSPVGPQLTYLPPVVGFDKAPDDTAAAFEPGGQTVIMVGRNNGPSAALEVVVRFHLDASAAGACAIVGRDLSNAEWQRYFGSTPVSAVCPP